MDLSMFLSRPPEEALRMLRGKSAATSFGWREVWKAEHQRVFTVAKAMRLDILQDIRDAVTDALEQGWSFEKFQMELEPQLRKKGWWGQQTILDPATGKPKRITLGTPHRLKTIFETNTQTAYQCGKYRRLTRPAQKKRKPFWQYIAVMDARTRASHAAMHGRIFRADDPIWRTHYPPNGFACRCTVRALGEKDIATAGLEMISEADGTIRYKFGPGRVEKGGDVIRQTGQRPDDGWDYHPCQGWAPEWNGDYTPDVRRAAAKSFDLAGILGALLGLAAT